MVVNGASVLQIELYDWLVKCHALQGHVNPMTRLRRKGVTTWKLKEHLVLKLWWWTGQVCYKLNCTTDLSSATPSKVTWIQWPLWGEKVSLHEKLKEHLVLKLCGEQGKCATNWIVRLTCQVPRPPRSRESNDPFEVKRCHCMKSLRNILSSSYVVNGASVLQIELYDWPVKCHALQGHVNPMTPLRWKGVTAWKA